MQTLQYLSFDVAAGAVCAALFATRAARIELDPFVLACLFMAVLCIYNVDHYLDARLRQQKGDARRTYHAEKKNWLLSLAILAFLAAAILMLHLPEIMIAGGLGMLLFLCIYFIIINKFHLRFEKEILVSAGYTAGAWIAALPAFSISLLPYVAMMFCSCWINVLVLSSHDLEVDRLRGEHNAIRAIGADVLGRLIAFIWICGMIAAALSLALDGRWILTAIAVAHMTLQGVLANQRFGQSARTIGDASYGLYALAWIVA